MSEHDRHALAGETVGRCARLLRIAGVVTDDELQLLLQHAAGGIDVFDREIRAIAKLFAERCVLTGHRTGYADGNLRMSSRTTGEHGGGKQANETSAFHSFSL